MFTVKIQASNGNFFSLALEPINSQGAPTTIRDAVTHPAVAEFFGFESQDEAIDDFCAIEEDGEASEVAGAAKRYTLSAAVSDNLTLLFDSEVETEEEAQPAAETEAQAPAELPVGTPGIVTVYTSGGMQSTNIQIQNLVTTVKDAIFNDAVRQRSAMNDAQLSNCVVTVNDAEVAPCALESHKLSIGDRIVLSPRSAHTKG